MLLDTPSILIGRASVCDVRLHSNQVLPIHFLVEWIGDGVFHPDEGEWVLFDISAGKASVDSIKTVSTGYGLTLDSQPFSYGELIFSAAESDLRESYVKSGAIGSHVVRMMNNSDPGLSMTAQKLLEVIRIEQDTQAVEDIYHLPLQRSGRQYIPRARHLQIQWTGGSAQVIWPAQAHVDIYRQGAELAPLLSSDGRTRAMPVTSGGMVRICHSEEDFFFRIVDRLPHEASPHSLKNDPIAKWVGGLLALGIALWFLPKRAEPPQKTTILTRIEIAAPKVTIPPAPRVVEVRPEPTPMPIAIPTPKPIPVPTPVVMTSTPAPVPVSTPALKPVARPQQLPSAPRMISKPTQKNPPAPPQEAQKKSGVRGILGLIGKGRKTGPSVNLDSVIVANQADADRYIPKDAVLRLGEKSVDGKRETVKTKDGAEVVSSLTKELQHGNTSFGFSLVSGKDFGPSGSGTDGSVRGALTSDQVKASVSTILSELRRCYDDALLPPKKGRRVVFRWTANATGQVSNLRITSSQYSSIKLDRCLEGQLQALKMPTSTGPTDIVFPFSFD